MGKKDKITNGKLTKETGDAVGAVEKTAGEKEDKKDEEMECEDGEKDEEDEGSTIFQREVSDYVHMWGCQDSACLQLGACGCASL